MSFFNKVIKRITDWYFRSTYKKIDINITYKKHHWLTGNAIFNEISPYYKYENIVVYFDFELSSEQMDRLAYCMVVNQSTSSDDSAYPMLNNVKFYFCFDKEYKKYEERYNSYLEEDLSCSRL